MASYSWEILTVSSGSWSCPNFRTGLARDLGLVVCEDQSNEFPDPIELVFEFQLIFDFELFEDVVVIELAFVFELFQGMVIFELAFVFELFQGMVVFELVFDFEPLL